jgi:short subunit dehydrogenase-like uncharacterized protein
MSSEERDFHVVVFGATGFTGALAAEYLAERLRGTDTRWAVAGRSRAKLDAVLARVRAVDPDARVGVLTTSVEDEGSMAQLARAARVVLSTVGPFALHGAAVVAACVAQGTDYVDITGEPEFVDSMIARYHAAARAKGVRVVSCCGFDSIPHDLGVFFLVKHLPRDAPLAVQGVVRAGGRPSGGTWASFVNAAGRARQMRAAAREARATERATEDTAGEGRRVRGARPRLRYDGEARGWLVPLPTIDPQVVLRSARALPEYGPEFSYGHYALVRSTATLLGAAVGLGAVAGLAQLAPTRKLLLRAVQQGEGPSAAQRARGWFKVQLRGEGGGRTVRAEVRGGDPGYTETAKMVSESALCLALDRAQLPARAGVITTAAAMGDALLARLQARGITFELTEPG